MEVFILIFSFEFAFTFTFEFTFTATVTFTFAIACAMSSSTRTVFAGGSIFPSHVNTMDFITIGSTGNAQDFGDLSAANSQISGSESDGHGGLQG